MTTERIGTTYGEEHILLYKELTHYFKFYSSNFFRTSRLGHVLDYSFHR